MSGETFRKLNLDSKNLDTKNLPTVVGANGTSLGAIGKINCEIEIGKKRFKQTFLVCENLTRSNHIRSRLCKTTCSRSTLDKTQLLFTHHQWRNSSRNKRTTQQGSCITEEENKTPSKKLCSSGRGYQQHQHR